MCGREEEKEEEEGAVELAILEPAEGEEEKEAEEDGYSSRVSPMDGGDENLKDVDDAGREGIEAVADVIVIAVRVGLTPRSPSSGRMEVL